MSRSDSLPGARLEPPAGRREFRHPEPRTGLCSTPAELRNAGAFRLDAGKRSSFREAEFEISEATGRDGGSFCLLCLCLLLLWGGPGVSVGSERPLGGNGVGGICGWPDAPCCLRNRLAPRLLSLSVSGSHGRVPGAPPLCVKATKAGPQPSQAPDHCLWVWGSGGQGALAPAVPGPRPCQLPAPSREARQLRAREGLRERSYAAF